jgi:hypothetical protein
MLPISVSEKKPTCIHEITCVKRPLLHRAAAWRTEFASSRVVLDQALRTGRSSIYTITARFEKRFLVREQWQRTLELTSGFRVTDSELIRAYRVPVISSANSAVCDFLSIFCQFAAFCRFAAV